MKNDFYHLVVAILISFGLLFAPLAAAVQDMQASGQMMAMSDEMPGCPGPMIPAECQKCPMMVVCLVKSLANTAANELGTATNFGNLVALHPRSDRLVEGLVQSPPSRPPRTLGIPA